MQRPDYSPTSIPLQLHCPGNGAEMFNWIMAHILEVKYEIIEIAYGTYAFKKVYRLHIR